MSILHTEWLSREHDWQFQLWQRFFFIFVLFTAALQGGHASIPWDSFVKWMVEAQQKEKSSVYTDPMISHQIHKGILSVFAGWKQVALSGIGRMHAVYACWITSKQDFDSGGLRVCRLAAWEHIWCGHFLCSALPFAPLALLAFSANVLRLKTSRFQQAMHLEDKRYVRSTGRLHLLLMFLFPQRRCYKASWRSVRCCAQARWEGNLFDCSLCLVHQVTSSFLKHPCSILKTITDDSGISRVCIKDAHGFGPDVLNARTNPDSIECSVEFSIEFSSELSDNVWWFGNFLIWSAICHNWHWNRWYFLAGEIEVVPGGQLWFGWSTACIQPGEKHSDSVLVHFVESSWLQWFKYNKLV